MAKSTNHTAHNQSYKNHRNGIKKPFALKRGQKRTIKGVRLGTALPAPSPPRLGHDRAAAAKLSRTGPSGAQSEGPSARARSHCPARSPLQMDPKFLRNLRMAKKHNGKGREE